MEFNLLLLALFCITVTWLAVHACRKLAWKLDVLDHPTDRKIHLHPIPYLGGLGIYAGMMISLAVAPLLVPDVLLFQRELQAFVIGATIVLLLGILDDLTDVHALIKLATTIGVGAFMYYNGFEIISIRSLTDRGIIPFENGLTWLGPFMTICWYVVIMNAINIIDGLDGLAAGVCAIAAGIMGLTVLGWPNPSPLALVLATVIAASCLGFLRHNWPPALVFMGDTGSLLLGLSLASLAVFSGSKASVVSALVIPVITLGIPVVDIGYAFLRRLASGKNPFKADRLHIHHRIMALGLPTQRILWLFYYITAYLCLLAYMLREASVLMILLNAVLLAVGFALFLVTLRALSDETIDATNAEDVH